MCLIATIVRYLQYLYDMIQSESTTAMHGYYYPTGRKYPLEFKLRYFAYCKFAEFKLH